LLLLECLNVKTFGYDLVYITKEKYLEAHLMLGQELSRGNKDTLVHLARTF